MGKETITFRIDTEKRVALDAIAAGLDRGRSYILNEAINLYLSRPNSQKMGLCPNSFK